MSDDFTFAHASARLRCSALGRGTPLILLHAGVADRRMWSAQLAAFGARYRTVSYDRRGFGETQCEDEAFSHAEDLDALVQHLGGEAPILVGCSQGARIAIDYALSRPNAVKAMVLVSPALSGAPSPETYPPRIASVLSALSEAEAREDVDRVNALEARLWLDGPLQREGRVSGVVRDLFLAMNGVALRHPPLSKEAAAPSAVERLGELAVPSLIISSDLDFPHICARARLMAESIPGAQGHVMTGCAHLPSLEQPANFIAAVERFLDQIPA